jgi:hypothetical protein
MAKCPLHGKHFAFSEWELSACCFLGQEEEPIPLSEHSKAEKSGLAKGASSCFPRNFSSFALRKDEFLLVKQHYCVLSFTPSLFFQRDAELS